MKTWTAMLMALISASAFGELIAGPAQVLDKPYGRVLFTLADGIKVECAAEDNHHQRIALPGFVRTDAMWGRDRVKKHQVIYGLDGEYMGETVRQVDLPLGKIQHGGDRFAAVFTGYVADTTIDRATEVERALEPIVDRKLYPLTLDDLRPHLVKFGYKKGVTSNGFDTYVCPESLLDSPNYTPRIALVFRANQFVAVITKREIHFIAHEPVLIREGYSLTYIEPLGKLAAARIESDLARALL
ncbi:MAG: hypothetical protein HZB26_09635 [Candidatus Hydrogenedentes bacterium]|nr:hypothetical protein [Candidatus Hydrogenedentota bacterium]